MIVAQAAEVAEQSDTVVRSARRFVKIFRRWNASTTFPDPMQKRLYSAMLSQAVALQRNVEKLDRFERLAQEEKERA